MSNKTATIYGRNGCPHCVDAKNSLGARAKFVDCDKDQQTCVRAGVSAVPHIVGPNNEVVVGWDKQNVARTMRTLGLEEGAARPAWQPAARFG